TSSSTTKATRVVRPLPVWTSLPRVILVKDDAVNRKLGSEVLKSFGCTLNVAVDDIRVV
ncbi:hypothetical protein BDN72DRAFT_719442, partial [Pluteus cervinus]